MSRLPAFFTQISPISETLTAIEAERGRLSDAVGEKNHQLAVSSAEESLSLWEKDVGLADGTGLDAALRRARIRLAMEGGQTLTAERLKELAVRVGGADRGEVVEAVGNYQVTLCALFDDREPEDLSELEAVVKRMTPAHLSVRVRNRPEPTGVTYHGISVPLQTAGFGAAASNENYAVFAGGQTTAANACDKHLTWSIPTSLSYAPYTHCAVSLGQHILFAGGCDGSYSAHYNTVNAYDGTLTRIIPAALSFSKRLSAAASNGTYALIGGGGTAYGSPSNLVDAYDENLTKTPAPTLATAVYWFCATSAGEEYALLSGGYIGTGAANSATNTGNYVATVNAYDQSLTRTNPEKLSSQKNAHAAAPAGDNAVFAGGTCGSSYLSSADAYDNTLTKKAVSNLSWTPKDPVGVSLDRFGLIAAGYGTQSYSNACYYDPELTKTELPAMSVGGWMLAASVGDYALFGGTSDVYTLVF